MSDHKDSGWRKRQIALDIKAENARKLGLDYKPNTITFCNDSATEVFRLSVDGIWVNPDVPIDDAAKLVLAVVEENIKVLVQTAVLAERNRTWTPECMCGICKLGPPKREWVGLTEQDRNDIEDYFCVVVNIHLFDAIEAKLKEKNT